MPFLFGADWAHAAPLVALLCLSGPARMLLDSMRIYWRAAGLTAHEFKISFLFAIATLAPIPGFTFAGLYAACAGAAVGASLAVLAFAAPLFSSTGRQKPSSPVKGAAA